MPKSEVAPKEYTSSKYISLASPQPTFKVSPVKSQPCYLPCYPTYLDNKALSGLVVKIGRVFELPPKNTSERRISELCAVSINTLAAMRVAGDPHKKVFPVPHHFEEEHQTKN